MQQLLFFILGPSSLPICIGSGVKALNAIRFRHADAFIIGTFFKKHGMWQNELDKNRISEMMEAIKKLKT